MAENRPTNAPWQEHFDQRKEAALAAGEQDRNFLAKKETSAKERLFLSKLGREAEMGGLMYELPLSGGLVGAMQGAERKMLLAVYGKREVASVESIVAVQDEDDKLETEIKEKNKVMLAVGGATRRGHINGIREVMNEQGGAEQFTSALIRSAETRFSQNQEDFDVVDFAMQMASVMEAAQGNPEMTQQITESLQNNALWKEQVVDSGLSRKLKVPNLSLEMGTVLPGAQNFEIPTVATGKLGKKLLKVWEGVIKSTTKERVLHYIEDDKLAANLQEQAETW